MENNKRLTRLQSMRFKASQKLISLNQKGSSSRQAQSTSADASDNIEPSYTSKATKKDGSKKRKIEKSENDVTESKGTKDDRLTRSKSKQAQSMSIEELLADTEANDDESTVSHTSKSTNKDGSKKTTIEKSEKGAAATSTRKKDDRITRSKSKQAPPLPIKEISALAIANDENIVPHTSKPTKKDELKKTTTEKSEKDVTESTGKKDDIVTRSKAKQAQSTSIEELFADTEVNNENVVPHASKLSKKHGSKKNKIEKFENDVTESMGKKDDIVTRSKAKQAQSTSIEELFADTEVNNENVVPHASKLSKKHGSKKNKIEKFENDVTESMGKKDDRVTRSKSKQVPSLPIKEISVLAIANNENTVPQTSKPTKKDESKKTTGKKSEKDVTESTGKKDDIVTRSKAKQAQSMSIKELLADTEANDDENTVSHTSKSTKKDGHKKTTVEKSETGAAATSTRKKDVSSESSKQAQPMSIKELFALAKTNDDERSYFAKRLHTMETETIKDAYRIKNLAAKTAKRTAASARKAFLDPYNVDYEVKETDRIFSGTCASFQPKNIFDDSDNDDNEEDSS